MINFIMLQLLYNQLYPKVVFKCSSSSIASLQSKHVNLSPLLTLTQHGHTTPIAQEETFRTDSATEFDKAFGSLGIDFATLSVHYF